MTETRTLTDRLSGRLPDRLADALAQRADRRPVVAVVRLHGVITATPSPVGRGAINLASVETALSRAFSHERLAAVALVVNSPGGSAAQSALVADRIRGLAAEKKVPVLAFCEDVAASGGYWLACAADEIYAHGTSLVGSIGVVSASFGLVGLLDRLGVERRVHTAGVRKARLDPFRPEQPEDVAWLTGIQADLHQQFTDWVRDRRGAKLVGEDGALFSGEVWTGAQALRLGLIDGLGTLRTVLGERFPDAHPVFVEPRRSLLTRLGGGGAAARFGLGAGAADQLLSALDALEQRAIWSRFGL
ncbi:MAG TPA: S49 family peptidase [Pseudonocardiaceae bacterium]|jgi:signal peptide peptidase SppA|nr:S49 family peptidase [Pseudonocardiaceae bacterium]